MVCDRMRMSEERFSQRLVDMHMDLSICLIYRESKDTFENESEKQRLETSLKCLRKISGELTNRLERRVVATRDEKDP